MSLQLLGNFVSHAVLWPSTVLSPAFSSSIAKLSLSPNRGLEACTHDLAKTFYRLLEYRFSHQGMSRNALACCLHVRFIM